MYIQAEVSTENIFFGLAPKIDCLLLALDLNQTGGLEDKRNQLIKHIKGWHLV